MHKSEISRRLIVFDGSWGKFLISFTSSLLSKSECPSKCSVCLVHCIALPAPHLQDLGNLSKPRISFPHFPMWKTFLWGWRGCINNNIEESNLQLPKRITERLIMWFIWEVALCGPQPFMFQNSLHINFFTNVFGRHLCSHKATCPVALETLLSLLQKTQS